jgi:molecular chaperone GrpE
VSSDANPDEPERVIIRDKRRIDPTTGEARQPDVDPNAVTSAPPAEVTALETAVAERTADLQRLQAEYANYRKRVERDRIAMGEVAVGGVLAALLPVLDDIDRARTHGDLTGAFKAVADQLDATLAKLGLVGFGEPGDAFDPSRHEAVMHSVGADVTEATATTVMRKGYQHGERLLRPAMVGVTDPESTQPQQSQQSQQSSDAPASEPHQA